MMNQVWLDGNCIRLSEIDRPVNRDVVLHPDNIRDHERPNSLHIDKTSIADSTYNDICIIIAHYGINLICISECTINDMPHLMNIVANNCSLHNLYIIQCSDFNDGDIMCIANSLSSCAHLTSIRLEHMTIAIDGFRHMMNTIITNTTLEELIINCGYLYQYRITDVIIETIPRVKSLRNLILFGRNTDRTEETCNALEKNYSIEYFNLYGFDDKSRVRAQTIFKRNRYIRLDALPALLNLAIVLVPLIRMYGLFDAYCMMWIYDYMNVYNIHVNEFKKIKIIKSVFEFYRRKMHDEQLVSAVSLCS